MISLKSFIKNKKTKIDKDSLNNIRAYHGTDSGYDNIVREGFKTKGGQISFAPHNYYGYKTALEYTKPRSNTMKEYEIHKHLKNPKNVISVTIKHEDKWAPQPEWGKTLTHTDGNQEKAVNILKKKGYRGIELYKTIPNTTLRKMYEDKKTNIKTLRQKGAQYTVFYPQDIIIDKVSGNKWIPDTLKIPGWESRYKYKMVKLGDIIPKETEEYGFYKDENKIETIKGSGQIHTPIVVSNKVANPREWSNVGTRQPPADKYLLIDGHHRFEAATRRGDETIPTKILDTPRQTKDWRKEKGLMKQEQEYYPKIDNISHNMPIISETGVPVIDNPEQYNTVKTKTIVNIPPQKYFDILQKEIISKIERGKHPEDAKHYREETPEQFREGLGGMNETQVQDYMKRLKRGEDVKTGYILKSKTIYDDGTEYGDVNFDRPSGIEAARRLGIPSIPVVLAEGRTSKYTKGKFWPDWEYSPTELKSRDDEERRTSISSIRNSETEDANIIRIDSKRLKKGAEQGSKYESDYEDELNPEEEWRETVTIDLTGDKTSKR
jgi:hypothetical protein